MKYASISMLSAVALITTGAAASAEALTPQQATAENLSVLAQVKSPVRLTDNQMAKITGGRWYSISYPDGTPVGGGYDNYSGPQVASFAGTDFILVPFKGNPLKGK
jgi:hypothetical protein